MSWTACGASTRPTTPCRNSRSGSATRSCTGITPPWLAEPKSRSTSTKIVWSSSAPEGFFGTVTAATIGTAGYSSTRNQHLADILESTPYEGGFVAENRGTGFQLMRLELESNHMGEPIVHDSIAMFTLEFRRRRAIEPETDRDEILYYIEENKPCSAADIAKARISPSTVTYRLKKADERGANRPYRRRREARTKSIASLNTTRSRSPKERAEFRPPSRFETYRGSREQHAREVRPHLTHTARQRRSPPRFLRLQKLLDLQGRRRQSSCPRTRRWSRQRPRRQRLPTVHTVVLASMRRYFSANAGPAT